MAEEKVNETTRTFFVGGNWKCNGTAQSVTELCDGLSKIDTTGVQVLVSPISIQLPLVMSKLGKKMIVACQNISATGQGAYTGEIAAEQICDMGLTTTLIGHSERRKYFSETNEVVTQKVQRALSAGLNCVCCLGETLDERKQNKVEQVCFASLQAIADGIGKSKDDLSKWDNIVIAYEPVWAIGTGVACDPPTAQATQASLRKWFKDNVSEDVANSIRIIYGGSVKPANCAQLIAQPDIDGFLIGGAALKADSFGQIIQSVQKQSGVSTTKKIVICGGGNAGHVATGFAANLKDSDVYLMSFFGDEADKFAKGLSKEGNLSLAFTQNPDQNIVVGKDKITCTNDPKTLANADLVIIALPAFCHQQYLEAIAANIGDKKGTIVGIFPGGWGLELQFKSVLGPKSDNVILLTGQDLPWACRIKEYGSSIEILGTKQQIGAGVLVGKNLDSRIYTVDYVFDVMKNMIGPAPILASMGHVLAMSLSTNIVVHPSIMYSYWKTWDGKPLKEKPLFYQGLTEEGADIMIKMSDEIIAVSDSVIKYLDTKGIKVDITIGGIFQWYKDAYTNQASDISSLYKLIQTCAAYDGLTHPCVEIKGSDEEKSNGTGFGPNYKYRYLTEDLPFGLVVIKGYAMLLTGTYKVDTPILDQIIEWCQEKLKKEYFVYKKNVIVDVGKDINSSRAPQAYGFKEIDQAIN